MRKAMVLVLALAAFSAMAVAAYAQSQSNPMACSLYAGGDYQTNWITINLIVVLLGVSVTAMIYAISKLLPAKLSSTLSAITRSELFQLMLAIVIIAVLIAMSYTVCTATTSFTQQIAGTQMTPFQYAEYYVGNLSLNTGLKLMTYVYSYSLAYMMDAQIYSKASEAMPGGGPFGIFNRANKLLGSLTGPVKVTITSSPDLGVPYSALATFYLSLFSVLIISAIGMLFIQFLVLPIVQATAFTVLLPTALILRSVAYSGGIRTSLRHTANAFIGIAVALYLVYPATIALDGYTTGWIYSASNPLYQYLSPTLSVSSIQPSLFSNALDSSTAVYTGVFPSAPAASQIVDAFYQYGIPALNPFSVPSQAITLVGQEAQFLFIAVILFAFNSAVTLAFAQSLARALNAGITGPISFWGNL